MKNIEIRRFAPLSYAGQEAINTLCTNLTFSGENMKRIMMTSTHASEGKSFLTMNVLRTMAKIGKRVVLVDADLRRSYIASRYGFFHEDTENQWGLAHFLAGMVNVPDIVYSTNLDGVYVVPVGRTVSNALPLLNSNRFNLLLYKLHFIQRICPQSRHRYPAGRPAESNRQSKRPGSLPRLPGSLPGR